MAHTMRALRLLAPGQVELVRRGVAQPGPGEALISVDVCGVCGSDVHLVDGVTAADYPITLGHEAAGTVAELGSGTGSLSVGTRVAVLPYIGCSNCARCRDGQQQACAQRAVLGVNRDGAHADQLVVPPDCLVPLPDSVPTEIGAILTDAVATPYHAIKTAGAKPGQAAVVFGLGGLGMHTHGGADLALEFVGHPTVVDSALRCLRPQGTCVVVGIGPERLALTMRQETLVGRELKLMGSFGCTRDELAELIELVDNGTLALPNSLTRLYKPEDFAEAPVAVPRGLVGKAGGHRPARHQVTHQRGRRG